MAIPPQERSQDLPETRPLVVSDHADPRIVETARRLITVGTTSRILDAPLAPLPCHTTPTANYPTRPANWVKSRNKNFETTSILVSCPTPSPASHHTLPSSAQPRPHRSATPRHRRCSVASWASSRLFAVAPLPGANRAGRRPLDLAVPHSIVRHEVPAWFSTPRGRMAVESFGRVGDRAERSYLRQRTVSPNIRDLCRYSRSFTDPAL
jgi:hypothetical protein